MGTRTELGPALSKSWRLDVMIDMDADAGTRDSPKYYTPRLLALWAARPSGDRTDRSLEHLKFSLHSGFSLFLDHLLQNITKTTGNPCCSRHQLSSHSPRPSAITISLFYSLIALRARIRGMNTPVAFTRLEVHEVTNLLIPSYHHTFPLPLVHTLRQLRLSKVSV